MTQSKPIIALTAGDVAGIGPEIIVRALQVDSVWETCHPIVFCQPAILQCAIDLVGADERFSVASVRNHPKNREELLNASHSARDKHQIVCCDPADSNVALSKPRVINAHAGDAAYQYLVSATKLALEGIVDAIATAPLNKAALHAAGHKFPGHTEILARECGVVDFAMMLHLPESRLTPLRMIVSGETEFDESSRRHGLSVAHVTLHTSVASVPGMLTTNGVSEKIRLLNSFLQRIGCERQAIGVCALNPHAGEDGLFGDEEERLIAPAVKTANQAGINVHGPLPVDTLFRRAVCGEFDGVVAMYHDQGHIPVKMIGFDSAVNITLGLPIVRTSPTHGTAFDRAWNTATPADPSGMIEAVLMAAQLCESN